jgi:asparagine synthase (glutamine-hydrolysing)
MCGIAGSIHDPEARDVRSMMATMRHRGPDDEGLHTDPRAGASIGVRRLAIMDVEGGHQPMSNEDRTIWVAFNGEIYNHARLRAELIARGHRFSTTGDTEVLVHLYEEFGDAMVHALEGMFTFAIWDEGRGRLLLARDRFGEKPLFLHEDGRGMLFASELTAILAARPALRRLEPAAIDAFFVLGYVPGPGTVVPGIRQLPPGYLLVWERDARSGVERRWWSPPSGATRLREPFPVVVAEAERLLGESVRTRMIADVPVGVFLSGGIDSTLVAAVAAREATRSLKTFTIGYDVGSFDERERARRVAKRLNTEHHEVTLTQDDVAGSAPELLARLDQPLADQALLPLHALSDFARPLVTVALGGEGADELFGGYPRYRLLERAARLESALPAGAARPVSKLLRYSSRWGSAALLAERIMPTPMLERHLDWVTGGRRHRRDLLYGPHLLAVDGEQVLGGLVARAGEQNGDSIGQHLMRLDQVDYLPDDVLMKTDRAGMLVSLEIRSVYLHRGLAELAASVDPSLHLRKRGKTLLRAMLPPGMGTPGSPGRYRKTAFRAPAAEWLRGPLAPVMRRQVQSGVIYQEGYFDRRVADELVREHASSTRDHSGLLWPLLALGLWADRFFGLDAG